MIVDAENAIVTGVAFVLPVFLVVLNFIGLLSAGSIAQAWRVAIVAIVVFAALITPAADVLSMFFDAAPMTLLFLAEIVIGPQGLTYYAQKPGEFARLLRAQVDTARSRAAESIGAEDWRTLDPRRYDPRQII
ncbi:twin-arginine translocase subunit TatC [Brevibacterium permense]|uniref:twin-arginine translocase subunit TatC n=1 Tax=Brevibacterium permense TaxID=234834 RepID=UPI0021D118C3|nr:twin-arginine translocase subunit TatC [Brevibacterium permense]